MIYFSFFKHMRLKGMYKCQRKNKHTSSYQVLVSETRQAPSNGLLILQKLPDTNLPISVQNHFRREVVHKQHRIVRERVNEKTTTKKGESNNDVVRIAKILTERPALARNMTIYENSRFADPNLS
jgi:hypothetical protein